MLIASGTLTRQTLAGQVAVVTGAGGGIGYEAARALVWLGARVVIAEINKTNGKKAAANINAEFGAGSALFIETDIGDERSVWHLADHARRSYGSVDIVLNNATIAPLGAVENVSIKDWDASYRVNLRGPVLLAQAFLPDMRHRNSGVLVSVSSTGLAYMGAYEIFKQAQVQLASTLDAELENTEVVAFTIGPGIVPTLTLQQAVPRLAQLYHQTDEEFYALVKDQYLSAEAAGAGFAAAIALAKQFRGQEISSLPALQAAGITIPIGKPSSSGLTLAPEQFEEVRQLTHTIRTTLEEQAAGWKQRSIFEQQWVIRDFRKQTGQPVEQWLDNLQRLETCAAARDNVGIAGLHVRLAALAKYYAHLQDLAKGYAKDPAQLAGQLKVVSGWQAEAEQLAKMLG